MLTPAFHFKILDNFMEVFNQQSADYVDHLDKLFEANPAQEVRLFKETSKATLNIVGGWFPWG